MLKSLQTPAQKQFFWIFAASALAHVLAAVWSQGYYSADEYCQILEFAGFKLGLTPVQDLALEYREQMRPWLLPWLVTGLVQGLRGLGIENPHIWVIFLRLISGALGWTASLGIARVGDRFFSSRSGVRPSGLQLVVWVSAAFLWFVPGLHVRPSSEAWSGAWMAIAFALFVLRGRHNQYTIWAGLFAGLAFESRFQSGIMIAGLLGAFVLQASRIRTPHRLIPIAGVVAGFLSVFLLGRVIDAWGYGTWVWSPWNYVHFNLIRGEVNRYDVAPFWDVFRMANTEAWPVLGFLLLLSWCVAWWRAPRSLLTGVTLPFFLVHCLIAHKELRFFFPITYFSPLLLATALEGRPLQWLQKPRLRPLVFVLLFWNAVGFIATTVSPTSRNVAFFKKLWDRGITQVVTLDQDPFAILATSSYFYRPAGWRSTPVRNWQELSRAGASFWLFRAGGELPAWLLERSELQCVYAFSTLPDFAVRLREAGWLGRAQLWTLWSCQMTEGSKDGEQKP